ncbi:MAG: ABC transporter ATP-binding protein [Rhodospirillales bacterium]
MTPGTAAAPEARQPPPPPAIELKGIDKRFGPVHANRAVSLSVPAGTIHGIVGENGAGKSTLMSILYGYYQADSGEIRVAGKPTAIDDPGDAIAAGIGMIHQHFMLVDTFTVLENVVLGVEGGLLLRRGMERARAELGRLEREYKLEVNIDAVVGDLSVGLRQRVEILKALYRGANVLILDEPTGVLTPAEADHLFRILRVLKSEGKTAILITHKLREVMAATDNVTVMRRGAVVGTVRTSDTNPEKLAEMMVGRKVLLRVERTPAKPGRAVLEIENLEVVDGAGVKRVRGVSFAVRAGEIVGIAGVAGNGQSELIEAIAGMRGPSAGRILLNGREVASAKAHRSPRELRELKLAHIPEDRLRMGLIAPFAAHDSAILGQQARAAFNTGPMLNQRAIVASCADNMQRYDVRPSDPRLASISFSGGNQQKIVLAREIEVDPAMLLVGQPTRGVDIGAIEFIHRRLLELRDAGKAILLVSVELDEILGLADRILVMNEGRVVGELAAEEADENKLGLLMAGIAKAA